MKTILIILLTLIVSLIVLLFIKTWKVKITINEKFVTIKLFNVVVKRILTRKIIQGFVVYKDDESAKRAVFTFKDVVPHVTFKLISVELSDNNPLAIEEIIAYGIVCQYNQFIRAGQVIGPAVKFIRKKGKLSFKARIELEVDGSILLYHYLKTRRSKIWKTNAR